MRFLDGTSGERRDRLVTALLVLTVLLIVLAAYEILGAAFAILDRFRQPVLIFIAGALIAYLMAPLVRAVQSVCRIRPISIAGSYLLLFAGLVALGVLLVNPFIQQARSLQSKLHNPSTTSLVALADVRDKAVVIRRELGSQRAQLAVGQSVPSQSVSRARSDMATLTQQLGLAAASPTPSGQIAIPPSYVKDISSRLAQLRDDYTRYQSSTALVDLADMDKSVRDASGLVTATSGAYTKATGTPILLINLQVWLDHHGIGIDLHDKFGSALRQASDQLAGIVDSGVSVALQAGGLLLNTLLILIVSVYFLSDGGRFVRWLVALFPQRMEGQADYFVASLNSILGSYLRTQILMALLAATLAAVGAVVFGVPYAIVIFLTVFFLSLVPVIGPLILPFPPLLIAVLFTPLPTPVFYLIWLLVGEQIVTNILGPKVQGHSVGIHPLEAMAAALIGFPIAGFLGSFFAVPAVAFLHVVIRSLVHANRQVRAAQAAKAAQTSAAVGAPLVETAANR